MRTGAAWRGVTSGWAWGGERPAETLMVGSSVVFDGADGAAVCGALTAGVSADGGPAAGASGCGAGCVGAEGGVCAEARTLSAAKTHNATAH